MIIKRIKNSYKINFIIQFIKDFIEMIITYFPGRTGELIRYEYYKKHLKHIGKNVKFDIGVFIQNPQFISIDDLCWIDKGVIILAGSDKSNRARRFIDNKNYRIERGNVYIGKKVHIAPYSIISGIGGIYISDECGIAAGTKIYSFSNHYRSDEFPSNRKFCFAIFVEESRQFMIEGPVFLGENVGVGLNSIILPGVSIGKDSFIGINSVVSTSFEKNSMIVGNPAIKIKDRFKS